jgi:PilZ domain
MNLQSLPSRLLVAYVHPEAFVDSSRLILSRLGYHIVPPEDFERMRASSAGADRQADLLIVDERRLADVPADPATPIILLSGRDGMKGVDNPRVIGAIRRPAGLHDLYRLAQQVFEDTPRTTPRVSTHLHARCERGGQSWEAAVLSLSENGCLLRSEQSPPLGSCFELSFALPVAGTLALRAEAAYQLVPDLGVVFSGIAAEARQAIGRFVSQAILT